MDPLPRGLFGLKRRQLFTAYLLLGSVLIVVGITAYTLRITREVEVQTRLITDLFSGMVSRLLFAGDSSEAGRVIEIINDIKIPLIVTDNAGRPIFWNSGVTGIPKIDDFALLMRQDPRAPTEPAVSSALALAAELDEHAQPYAILDPQGRRIATLHYGQSALDQQIRIMPYLELAIMVLFFLAILWGLQVKKENEQNLLFAGMAKETAHQLGTPLTSIMGWLALLQDRAPAGDDTLPELAKDVERLNKVSARFSQIGSLPKLDDSDLVAVVEDTITYFRRRLPHLGGRVELRAEGAARNPVVFNRDLLEWVLENLIKNGIDALEDGKGTVSIRLNDLADGGVMIRVCDTGRGIKPSYRAKIFEPGFSTKARGWGMGLALVKRIVTQYHGGRIRVESTGPQGTVFAISLPGKDR
ncbi:MAG TPA: HAMP domain-containing sensor histidine kinase [Candidatus Krumholzibacteria bacterium]|nr:HAMP domain-containing sensor histidine kinase [Candidatus Krumholzibacteria bacterium]HPD72163.1 HAMP domain-containing sensor histidine kinase [Candidatus Krumholzibacteria bacterium]HRY40905.1 HAMP domain-containing sensor histidine kinase [Candidatus Krumholzibacteria bacterium]